MGVQCKKCGSRSTSTVNAKAMAEKTGDGSFTSAARGTIDPTVVIEAVRAVAEFLGKLFGWMAEKEKNQKTVVVCSDCGYWERV